MLLKTPLPTHVKPERAAVGQSVQALFANLAASTVGVDGRVTYAAPLTDLDQNRMRYLVKRTCASKIVYERDVA